MKLKKKELEKIWKQLDGALEALERLGEYEEGQKLLEEYENSIDFFAIVSLKNNVEELIGTKTRKTRGVLSENVTTIVNGLGSELHEGDTFDVIEDRMQEVMVRMTSGELNGYTLTLDKSLVKIN